MSARVVTHRRTRRSITRLFSLPSSIVRAARAGAQNAGVTRGTLALVLACRGLYALLVEGVPGGDLVFGTSPFIAQTCAMALGFFLYDTFDSLNMYLTFGVVEETLFVHHILGILLYCCALATQSYMFLTTIVLVEVSGGVG